MSESRRRIATLLATDLSVHGREAAAAEPNGEDAPDAGQEILLRLIQDHGGRFFNTAGNSRIAEFSNAIDAVHCAVAIQQAMLGENDPLDPDERVLLRIGMSVGDVTEENDKLRGDGVDVAVGLQALAVPGGICLAASVFEHVKNKVHVGVEYAGDKRVKNISEPVAIYQVVEPGVAKGRVSLWEELRRRNVFRVGAAYAVVSWLLIQVADVALTTFDSPVWIMQGLISVIILGFPIAVVFAWIYELTPMGLQRSDDVLRQASIRWLTGRRLDGAIISLLVVAVVFLVYDNYVAKGIVSINEREPASIAVLAFENHSTNPEDRFFADGLAEELLNELGRIKELKVASRTASFYFKGKDVDVATIASTLEVDNVLSGSVRREGQTVRVTAALDDTVTGDLLWTQTYDNKLEAILDIQSDIAQSVATAIVPVLSPESRSRIEMQPTENAEAYQYYLRGRDFLRQPAEEASLASAIDLFGTAISLDRRFAHAYAGLCNAYIGTYEFVRTVESFEAAESSCHRALTLDDGLWEVHVALGNLYRTNGQFDSAVSELETAIEKQPNTVSPYLALAQTYAGQKRLELAEATFLKAEEVDGGYWGVHRAFGNFLFTESRYDEAIERHIRVTELVPDSGIGYDNLGNSYLQIGEFAKAESAFNASPLPSRWTFMNRGLVHYFRGDYEKAVEDQQQAINLAPQVHASWGFMGDAYRFLPGEEQKAQDAYEMAIQLVERHLAINPTDWRSVGQLGMYYAYAGRPDEAVAQTNELLELSSNATAFYFATRVRVHLGDIEGAYESLQKTVAGGWSRVLLASNPDIERLRGEPGYEVLLAETQE